MQMQLHAPQHRGPEEERPTQLRQHIEPRNLAFGFSSTHLSHLSHAHRQTYKAVPVTQAINRPSATNKRSWWLFI